METMENEQWAKAKIDFKKAKRLVFLCGAGLSTASGIPDFRSKDGRYRIANRFGYPPETILSHRFFFEHPDIFYDYFWSEMSFPDAEPNRAHRLLAAWSERVPLFVVTQNIDGLEEKSGIRRIIPVHGNAQRFSCPSCAAHFSRDAIEPRGIPRCPKCGEILKPDVTLYGEALEEEALLSAVKAVEYADLLVIGGTSMTVYPISELPRYFHGQTMIVLNRDETQWDNRADFVFCGDLGESLGKLLEGIA